MECSEKEIRILENINISDSSITQRELSSTIGASLGMTNSILKRLVNKGLLSMRRINERVIRFYLTPRGIEAVVRKRYRYFRRPIRDIALYRGKIEMFVGQVGNRGYSALMLIGHSDLDFIVERACALNNILIIRDETLFATKVFRLYAETYIPDNIPDGEEDRGFLQELLF